jgi:hypothetical protein
MRVCPRAAGKMKFIFTEPQEVSTRAKKNSRRWKFAQVRFNYFPENASRSLPFYKFIFERNSCGWCVRAKGTLRLAFNVLIIWGGASEWERNSERVWFISKVSISFSFPSCVEMHLRRGESKRLLHVFGWRSARHINMCRRACTHNWLHTQKKVKLKMRPSSKGGAERGQRERERERTNNKKVQLVHVSWVKRTCIRSLNFALESFEIALAFHPAFTQRAHRIHVRRSGFNFQSSAECSPIHWSANLIQRDALKCSKISVKNKPARYAKNLPDRCRFDVWPILICWFEKQKIFWCPYFK